MAEDRVINLEIKDNVKTLKQQYKEAVKELQQMAATYGEMSDEAVAAAKRAAELKDQIEDTNDLMQSFKGEGAFIAMNKAMTAVASGFSAIEGGVALAGVESEKLQETMVKLQASMALAQGLEGLEDAGRAFGALQTKVVDLGRTAVNAFQGMTVAGKAFAVTGIGLLITGIGLLIANWDKLTGKANANTEAQKKNMEAAKARQDAVAEAQKSAIDSTAKESIEFFKLANALKETNANSKERQKIINQLNNQYGTTLKNLKDEAAFQEQINKAVQDFIKYQNIKIQSQVIEQQLFNITQQRFELETKLQGLNVGNAKTLQNLGKEQKKTNDIIGQSLNPLNNQIDALSGLNQQTQLITKNQNEAYNKQGNQTIAQAGKIKEQIGKLDGQFSQLATQLLNLQNQMGGFNKKTELSTKLIANYTRQVEKEKIDAMEDGMEKRLKLLEFQRQEELKDIDKTGVKAGELRKAIEERYEKEIQKVKDEYRDRSDRDNEIVLEKNKAFITTKAEQEIDAEKYVQGELAKLRQEENDKEIQRKKDLVEAWTRITLQGLDLIASIAEENAGKDEKRQRAAFNIRKASNIAQATIDGYKAVLSTYSDTPGGIVVKTIAATIAGGFAALKIGQIAKSKYESSASGGGGGGDLASGGTESFAPQFNVIGSSGINQLAQLTQQPVQAYVVSGEVTSAQALDRNRQKNATL